MSNRYQISYRKSSGRIYACDITDKTDRRRVATIPIDNIREDWILTPLDATTLVALLEKYPPYVGRGKRKRYLN